MNTGHSELAAGRAKNLVVTPRGSHTCVQILRPPDGGLRMTDGVPLFTLTAKTQ